MLSAYECSFQSEIAAATGRGKHQDQHSRCVCSALGLDVRPEDQSHHHIEAEQQQHQRTRIGDPFRRQSDARQISRHQMQQSGHGRRAREPQHQNRRKVVDRAKDVSQILMRHIGDGAAAGRAAFPIGLFAESAATETKLETSNRTLMMSAAVASSLRVFRMRPRGRSAVASASAPAISGITETPVSKPLNPSASRGNRIAAAKRQLLSSRPVPSGRPANAATRWDARPLRQVPGRAPPH